MITKIVKPSNNTVSVALRCVAFIIIPHYAAVAQTEISFSRLQGDADGYLQTPAGGQPGSTTTQRPTLKELGFDGISIYGIDISRVSGKHKIRGGYQIIRADGSATLEQDLTSQNKNFSKGDAVKTDLQADWFRLDWLYRWSSTEITGKPFVVSPGAGLVVFDFHYQLENSTLKVNRAYAKLGHRIGVESEWLLTDKFKLQFDIFEGLPVPNTPVILSAELKGKYTYRKTKNIGSIAAGVVYNRIEYQDEQTVPNHIRIETGPLIKLDLSITF